MIRNCPIVPCMTRVFTLKTFIKFFKVGVSMSLNLDAWTKPDVGALFVVTGASGTGKTTLVKCALAAIPNIQFSVSPPPVSHVTAKLTV